VLLFALAGSGEEFFHAAGHFFGAIDGEGEFRNMADAHAVSELRADVGAGGHEAFEGGVFLFFGAVDGDEDAGGFAAGREDDIGDIAGSDAWVGEFPFKHCADLFGEGVGDSVAVIRSSSLLRHIAFYCGERLRIPNYGRLPYFNAGEAGIWGAGVFGAEFRWEFALYAS
jgi:hypothetical protein